jgi:DNA-binding NtrC family response regulator
MPKLEIYEGTKFSKNYILPDADLILIGRTQSSDVVLPDERRQVSRLHAALVRMSGSQGLYFIRDLGSTHGTSVDGVPTHQRILHDGAVIHIGSYRLIFSKRTVARFRTSRLKIVPGRPYGPGTEASTSALRLSRTGEHEQFTAEQRELLEQFEHKFQREATLVECADDLVAAILHTIHADCGFLGILSQGDSQVVREFGITNLAENEEIEISDASFAEYLMRGETVEDGGTLLVPFAYSAESRGYLCVSRRDHRKHFNTREVDFLQAVAHLIPRCIEAEGDAATPCVPPVEPMEWPIEMVGRSKALLEVSRQINAAVASKTNVLVLGESGSGKELVARAMHRRSSQGQGPFLAKNCSQTTETLAEAEIFGYAPKSGISGADAKGAPGWFELANGGTLFLDEVHCLVPPMQDKFLRVMQDKQLWRIGAQSSTQVEVNIVAATDEDVDRAVEDGRFRKPFFYRFGAKIQVAPLRERREDIPLLAFYFLDKYAKVLGSRSRTISRRALHILWNHAWPGNVRQLEHAIKAGVAKDHEVIFSWDLEDQLQSQSKVGVGKAAGGVSPEDSDTAAKTAARPATPKSMEEVEKEHIKEALEVTRGNVTKAAETLGYSRQTILNKMDSYGIPRNYADPEVT